MFNLLLFVYLPYCTSLSVSLCVFVPQRTHVETRTCFIPTTSLPGATSPSWTQEHMHWMQIHTLKGQKKSLRKCGCVHLRAHKRERYRTKAQRKCAEATAVWSLWHGHCGECGGGVSAGNWVQRTGLCLVWWNDADPHSSGLTEDYFGAFWTLPRKHNNFGVSSFIYL